MTYKVKYDLLVISIQASIKCYNIRIRTGNRKVLWKSGAVAQPSKSEYEPVLQLTSTSHEGKEGK